MTDVDHPVSIVTGAGSGIGRAISIGLAQSGHRLVLLGRTWAALTDTQALIRAKVADAPETLIVTGDIGVPNTPATIIKRARDTFGRIDTLINNAACGPLAPIDALDEAELNHTFEVDVFGPFRLVAALWPVFAEQGGGCVVNISSMATVDPFPGLSIYAAAKSGLESLTRSIHNEGSDLGIRAFSIAPGAVETAMLRSIISAEDLPTENTLSPEDIASVVVDCVAGTRNGEKGQTILVPSP